MATHKDPDSVSDLPGGVHHHTLPLGAPRPFRIREKFQGKGAPPFRA